MCTLRLTGGALVEIVVRGKNVQVPPALREIAEEKVAKITRYAHDCSRIEVDFSELRNPRVAAKELCEVTVHLKGHHVKAHAASIELHAALDLAIDKLEHQVARLKDKRVGRSHPRRRELQWAVRSDYDVESDQDENGDDTAARIVKTKQFPIKPMDPHEAALQMDLLNHDFFLFLNTDSNRACVIYRRRDGHFGLIDSGA